MYAESVCSYQCHTPLGRALSNRGAPFSIYQALFNHEGNFVHAPFSIKYAPLCTRPFQSSKQLWACALFNQVSNFEHMAFSLYQATWDAPFPINQTICQELRVDGGIAQPGLVKDTCTSVVLVSCLSSSKPVTVGVTLP
jgi:hypothetical protein